VTTTTSLRQGRFRKEGSVGAAAKGLGSQRQNCEPTDRNVIEGRVSGASWHNTTKPKGLRDTVNDAVVQGKFTFLSGEICAFDSLERDGRLTEVWRETAKKPQNPKAIETARRLATTGEGGRSQPRP